VKLSIIVSVLNSHEVVRRQLLHFERMTMPEGVEIIYLDDGSDPPLEFETTLANFAIHSTNDTRAWTVEAARNMGARLAKGEYVLMTDLDYIITQRAIEESLTITKDKMRFKREFGVLDDEGRLTQDHTVLRKYGLLEERFRRKGTRLPPHPNNFVMRKTTFFELGGYLEDRVEVPYPNGADGEFKRRWHKALMANRATMEDHRPMLYMFPNGQFCGDVDYNPFNLFHGLSRKSPRNPYANMSS
jgi:glycosyltransferase involved in cell wall biosynthesis